VNNDFGRAARDVITQESASSASKVVADLSTEAGQADFAADVTKGEGGCADAVFVYLHEDISPASSRS